MLQTTSKTKKLLLYSTISLATAIVLFSFTIAETCCLRGPTSEAEIPSNENFVHIEHLRLTDFKDKHFFLISNTESYSQLLITNEMTTSPITLNLELTCDQKFQFGIPRLSPDISTRNLEHLEQQNSIQNYRFQLESTKGAIFLLGNKIKNCELKYYNVTEVNQSAQYKILSEDTAFPLMKNLVTFQDNCVKQSANLVQNVDSFFTNQSFNQLTCLHPADQFETLETPESGFIAKTEMLLGYKLDSTFISNQNPYADIDFSKAPKLKAIFLATLVYRSDFYGNVMARLLKFHAERGTIIHLITTGYMMLEKDKKLLRNLAANNGNFRLQEFKYIEPKFFLTKPLRYIDSKYRDMHIKLLITLSDEEHRNAVVLGGRNIHDGFLFKTKPDYSRYPELVQYGIDEDFVHWNDFEMKITSKEIAQITAAHLLKFWNRDTTTQTLTPVSASEKIGDMANNEQLRHFISLPYNDDMALEKMYVSLIDSAQSSIQMSSPYLRPTEKILSALQNAAARHVDITIQTRVSLQGDTQAWLYEEVNKESINKLFQAVKIYEWQENSILHSKFILVDGKVAFVGSVNLSRRSFVQDVENGFLIQNPVFIEKMNVIFKSYISKSKQITQAEDRKFLPSILIRLFKNQF